MPTPRKLVKKVTCSVCQHSERHRIEVMRVGGMPVDALAEQFKLSRDAIYRHMHKHVSPDLKAAIIADVPIRELAERAAAESMSLLDYLHLVRSTVVSQMLVASSVNDGHRVASLAKRATELLKEIGRLTGEIMSSAPVTNITNNTVVVGSPFFTRLERMLIDRLAPHPSALSAVLDGLEELEHDTVASRPASLPVTLEHVHG